MDVLDTIHLSTVQHAGLSPVFVECDRHGELALAGDRLTDLINLQRVRRIDREQGDGI